jgi:RNA polymerase sigma-70 factor (ECF subfamily)
MRDIGDNCSSLLQRLQAQDQNAWAQMMDLYYPLVYSWCQRKGLQPQDAADTAQEVFRAVFRSLEHFQKQPGRQGFAAWLRGITQHKLADYWRARCAGEVAQGGSDARARLAQIAQWQSSGDSDSSAAVDEATIVRRALDSMRNEFEPRTYQAFWRVVVDEASPVDVAHELGISVNAVYLAKSRVLRRLREELQGLNDAGGTS